LKAIKSQASSKSFFSSLFGRKSTSDKYGYYGLNLLWREAQDQGRINEKYISNAIDMIKFMFADEILEG